MDYVNDGREDRQVNAKTITTTTELGHDHPNKRKFYRVKIKTLTPFKLELS